MVPDDTVLSLLN